MRTLLLAALLGVLGAQAPAPTQQSKDGVIEVTVRDSLTKAPIPGARVTFIFYQTPPPNVVTYVNADENGWASFKDLAFGTYGISAEHVGYVRQLPGVAGPPVSINETSRKHVADLVLIRGATVRGRVLGPDGMPVAQAQVTLRPLGYAQGRRIMSPAVLGQTAAPTDDRGDYTVSNLPSGDYYVRVELGASGPVIRNSSANDNLPRVTYYPGVVDPLAAPRVTVKAPDEIVGMDIRIPNVKAYRVSGTVLNTLPAGPPSPAGRPAYRGAASFFIGSPDPNSLEDPILVPSRSGETANPDEFTFELGGLLPGTYYLYPLFNLSSGFAGYISTRAVVTLEDKDLENLRLVLEPNPEIKGRLVVEGDASGTAVNMQTVRIGARAIDRLPSLLRGVGATANITDQKTGDFVLAAFQKGVKFGMTVTGLPPDSYIADLRQGSRNLNNDGAVLADASEGVLQITVGLQGGTIQGTVVNATGQPHARAAVVLIPSAPRRANTLLYKRGGSDASGQFTLRGISPGEYKVFAFTGPPAGQAEENADFIAPLEARGTAVTIQTGASRNLQLTVVPLP
jgi:hypothetical protein